MSEDRLSNEALNLLNDPAFALPKTRSPGDFGDFLEYTYAVYFDRLDAIEEPLASLLAARKHRIGALSAALVAAWRLGWKDDLGNANSQLDEGVGNIYAELVSMSRRHSVKVLKDQSWYRLAAWQGVHSREHMFHTPFERSQKSYRFSTPGAPTLYLANSVYLCWLECGRPNLERCFVSRFEIDATGYELLDLPCNHRAYLDPLSIGDIPGVIVDPRNVMNSPYYEDVLTEIADYLTVWPLLAAVSVQKLEPAHETPPEYVIPQLLMGWTRESGKFLGIRYFTSKHDPSTNSQDWSVNLALSARTNKKTGYCDFLRARVRCTEPQSLSAMREKESFELATGETVVRRERRQGRVIIRSPEGTVSHYFDTEFGKMEYWLDREEIAVGPIKSG